MTKEPWLDDLSDDWVPPSPSPSYSPSPSLPTASVNHSARKCIGCTHRSRIPRPPDHSSPGFKGKGTPKGPRQAQVKKGGNISPSPRPSPRTSPRLSSPAKGASNGSSKQATPSRKKPSSTPSKNMVSARSSSNASNQTTDQGTVQIRSAKEDAKGTPEWRRRLINGDIPADDQCDLFAPLALESMFKPPKDTEKTRHHEEHRAGQSTRKCKSIDAQTSKHGSDDQSEADLRVRSASGQEEIRNEGITPIFLSRNNTANCRTTSGVLRSAMKQLDGKLEQISQNISTSTFEGDGTEVCDTEQNIQIEDLVDVTSQSLPADLSTGTQEIIDTKTFVNFRRGGYSEDGSFRMRRLSPSSYPSRLHSSSFLTNSKIRSSPPPYDTISSFQDRRCVSPQPVQPPTVTLSPAGDSGSDRPNTGNMNSSGSPLKLFGTHDTFTNNKLLRRISQFEETYEGISEEDAPTSPSLGAGRKRANRSLPNLRRGMLGGQSPDKPSRPESQDAVDPRMNRFGNGQLDDFDFPNEHINVPRPSFKGQRPLQSRLPKRTYSQGSRQDNLRKSKSLDSITEGKRLLRGRQRGVSRTSELPSTDDTEYRYMLHTPGRSTPKRRRTSQQANEISGDHQRDLDELANSMRGMSLLQMSLQCQGIKHDTEMTVDSPQSKKQSTSPTTSPGSTLRDRKSATQPHSTRVLNADGIDNSPDGRKRSLATQDFFDEATKIMSMIRAKGKYRSGLTSVEESDLTSLINEDQTPTEESSLENLSRPPSRDGGVDMRKLREPRRPHPRIVSHLKKFAEKDDTDILMASVTSLHLDKGGNASNEGEDENSSNEVDHYPPNIRLRENPFLQRKRKHSESDENLPIHDTHASAHSIPTTSSSSSNTKGVIPSDMISHLIPEQVNGMTYDRSAHTWVKKKISEVSRARGDDSEDDPFSSIPDLSVDESEEMRTVERCISHQSNNQHTTQQESKLPDTFSKLGERENQSLGSGSGTRDGAPPFPDSSSIQSKATPFTSSGPRPETRATSWATGDLTGNVEHNLDNADNLQRGDTEHEIKLHGGRMHPMSQQHEGAGRQPRVVTISFSSPLVSHIAYSDNMHGGSPRHTPGGSSHSESILMARNDSHNRRSLGHRTSVSAPSRRTSLEGRPFIGRPISRIDEQNEDSVGELSLVCHHTAGQVVSTPQSCQVERPAAYLLSSGHDTSYSFHLSPLPDFTMHQIDDPLHLELTYIAQRTHPSSLRQVHGTFALAEEDLVKHITDVQPFEPYWDHIRRLDLRGKGLITLHKLNKFCPRLEELDVSGNALGQLSGAPSTLRNLRVQHNFMSNLTAWSHLVNLQYLDVSGNRLESLDGFSALIHLRELRANHNKIRNIDGILDLDGLLNLELRHNALTEVDFEGAELTRLRKIDLSNNQLTAIRNVDFLPALESFDLHTNQITNFQSAIPMANLRFLRLSNNRLNSLHMATFPNLTLLYLDNNCLATVNGLERCSHLEVLSLRSQSQVQSDEPASVFDLDLSSMKEIRKLFLSENRLSARTLAPSVPALNLQLLDIASCGLNSLPARFGRSFPNLRVLNLNFNALTELGDMTGMNGLGRLMVVGNRISRLRMLCQVISKLNRADGYSHGSLRTVDLRLNPLTIGFYPPATSGSGRDDNPKLLEFVQKRPDERIGQGSRENGALATLGRCGDIALPTLANEVSKTGSELDVEIDDPYTIPSVDAEADRRYRSHLDEATRMKRMVLELMLYAGSGGAIRILDGLELRPILEGDKAEMDQVWDKLEGLGVLKRKAGSV